MNLCSFAVVGRIMRFVRETMAKFKGHSFFICIVAIVWHKLKLKLQVFIVEIEIWSVGTFIVVH